VPYKTRDVPVGTRFDRVVTTGDVILRPRSDGRRRAYVPIRCDCGTERVVVAGNLLSGNTKSCGCLHRERASQANLIHGHAVGYAKTRLYRIWRGMRNRCLDARARNYRWYGGRGISISAAWDTFPPFIEWAIANGYADGVELDRRDVDLDYSPENCRWVTKKQNIRNRDFCWDEHLDARLAQYAVEHELSPYQVIKQAVEQLLAVEEVSS
jgi:hypothetical protein